MKRCIRFLATPLFILIFTGRVAFWNDGARAETLVLQPGPEGKDSFVTNIYGSSSDNYGDLEWFDMLGLESRAAAYIEFDLSSIPAGSLVVSAEITLWAEYGDGELYIEPAASAWEEMVITWENHPDATIPRLTYPISRGEPGAPCHSGCSQTFDIAGIAQFWIDGSNFGLIVTANTQNIGWMMASSDNLTHARPMLSVSYTTPVGVESNTWGQIKTLYR